MRVVTFGGEKHIQYYNRLFGYVLRPAHHKKRRHNAYAPGLHHFCFRVLSQKDVFKVTAKLRKAKISTSDPKVYPQYADDYFAIFFRDPDGIRLEVTNFRAERRKRYYQK